MTNTNKCSGKKKTAPKKSSNFLKKNSTETQFICYLKFYLANLIQYKDKGALERIRTNGTYQSTPLTDDKIEKINAEIEMVTNQITVLTNFNKNIY
jgi:hypothetical protein